MRRTVILFLGLLIVLGGNCTKNPTGPGTATSPILYALSGGANSCLIYFIDTATDSVMDSMTVSCNSPFLRGVSPDGSKLYLMDQVIDTRNKTVIAGARTGVPTPDGKRLLYTGIGPFQVIDAETNQVLYSDDTLHLGVFGMGREFDAKNGLVYGELGDMIGVFDYRKLEYLEIIDPVSIGGYNVGVTNIVVSNDGGKLYYVSFAGNGVFTAIDLVRDTVIGFHILNGYPWLGVRPDDRFIYVTDAGGYGIPPEPSGNIRVYSPYKENFLQPIELCQYACPYDSLTCPYDSFLCRGETDQIALTPDGRKAYVTAGSFLLVLDTGTNQVIKILEPPRSLGSLAIQRKYGILQGGLP